MRNKQHEYILKAFLESTTPMILKFSAPELISIDSVIGGYCTQLVDGAKSVHSVFCFRRFAGEKMPEFLRIYEYAFPKRHKCKRQLKNLPDLNLSLQLFPKVLPVPFLISSRISKERALSISVKCADRKKASGGLAMSPRPTVLHNQRDFSAAKAFSFPDVYGT